MRGSWIEPLAVGHRPVDVGAAAELHAEEQVHRVVALLGQVDHLGVEDDDVRLQGRHAGEDGPGDAAVDDRVGHRAGLVHADDDVPLLAAVLAGEEVEVVGDDRPCVRGRSS